MVQRLSLAACDGYFCIVTFVNPINDCNGTVFVCDLVTKEPGMIYRFFSRVLCCSAIYAMFAISPVHCFSDIVMNIWDDGTNLYMQATGSYDFSNVTPNSGAGLGANAKIGANQFYGWEAELGSGTESYTIAYIGALTGTGTISPATTVTNSTPFFFFQNTSSIVLPTGTPNVGTVNESAVFNGTTLAGLGMLPGETVTVSWGTGGANEGGSINTFAPVPEPSTAILGIGVAGLLITRRRKR